MKKTLFTILGIAGGILCSQAQSSVVEFSYAGDDVSNIKYFGSNGSERQSLAIRISDPLLAGYKVTKIKAFLSEKGIYTRPEIWMSTELKIEKRQNAPDIFSETVEAVPGEYMGFPCNVLEYTLTEPYELGEKGVFIGSSVTTSLNNSTEDTPPPFLVYNYRNDNGFYYFGTTSAQSWTDMGESLELIRQSGLSQTEINAVLGGNATRLLNLI